jgi:aminomuconate-semialdehyde/2-hydroxymuconate-6-semialdehyde dehydrogenase
MHFATDSHHMEDKAVNYTLRQPFGVVACISPWNLPLYLFTWKIAPAIAAGNCVVAKPSEMTPVTAYLLAHICKEAGLPDGVLNIIHGTGAVAGEAIVKTGNKIFYGQYSGERIALVAAPKFKKLSLELGGKNPTIIFADCDWGRMLKSTIDSSFSNQGQICLCGSRILIEETIYEKFKAAFVEGTKQLTVGDPLDEDTRQGAIVSKEHFNKVIRCIDTATGRQVLWGMCKVERTLREWLFY